MSLPAIRRALEAHLAALPTRQPTVLDNPRQGPRNLQPYRRAALLPAETDNPTWGGTRVHARESGIFQVLVCVPEGSGVEAAEADAEAVRHHYRVGDLYTADGVHVAIPRTPSSGPGRARDGYYCVPVSVRYQAEIFQ